MTALGIPQIREFFRAESVMVHEERFPPPRLSAGCAFRKETIAGMYRDGRDAPKAAVPVTLIERSISTPYLPFAIPVGIGSVRLRADV